MNIPAIGIYIGRGGGISGPNGAPSGLMLTIVSDSRIDLSWDYPYNDEDGFQVMSAWSDDNITFSSYAEVAKVYGVHVYSNTGLTKNYYRYEVRAFIDSDTVRIKPAITSAEITVTNQVVLTFDRDIKPISEPATSAFLLAGKTITDVTISGATVTLTVSVSYAYGDVITVNYTKPATNPIKGLTGNVDADSFTGYSVTNSISNILPVFVSAAVANAAPTKIILTYDTILDAGSVPAAGDFTVTDHTVSSVAIAGATVELTLSTAFILFDWLCYVTYTKGVNPIRRDATYGEATNLASTLITNDVLDDGYSVARYDPSATGGRVHSSGVESIYWDLIAGSTGRGSLENSGTTVAYGVYEIFATETNHFYTGCQIGDIFPSNGAIALDANNTVKRVTGNHATQPVTTNKPTNQIFDGVDNFMMTAPFTFNSPKYVFLVAKAISWTSSDIIIDGNTQYTLALQQFSSTPNVRTFGSGSVNGVDLVLGEIHLLRLVFANGTNSSKIQLDSNSAVLGNSTAVNPGAITLGAKGGGSANWANFQLYEVIFRTNAGASGYETSLYNALKRKWSTP